MSPAHRLHRNDRSCSVIRGADTHRPTVWMTTHHDDLIFQHIVIPATVLKPC
jgi:hypothetical protein